MATTLANFLIATPFSPHSPGTEPSTADLKPPWLPRQIGIIGTAYRCSKLAARVDAIPYRQGSRGSCEAAELGCRV